MFDEEEDRYFGHEDEDRQLEGEDGWIGVCSTCGCDIYAHQNYTTEFKVANPGGNHELFCEEH